MMSYAEMVQLSCIGHPLYYSVKSKHINAVPEQLTATLHGRLVKPAVSATIYSMTLGFTYTYIISYSGP